ncbi:MAG TPA: hypothetical protein VFI25_12760 [Planctomycetota bacterium]|nr:hypothetical protein [Planctomycetota bacterium]
MSRTPFRRFLPFAALPLALALLPGCAALVFGALAGAGTLVAHQTILADDSYEVFFRTDADRTFAVARGVLEDLDPSATANPDARTLAARFDGAALEVEIDHESKGLSRLAVKARRYGFAAQGTAKTVAQRIARRVNEVGPG